MTSARSAMAALVLALAVAGPAAADFRDLEGAAGYDEETALPAEAVLEVQLLALPRSAPLLSEGEQAAPAQKPAPIATVLVRVLGGQPYPFRLAYDEAMVEDGRNYAVAARITLDGETVFESAEAVPVFTDLSKGPVSVRLVRPDPEHPLQPSLANTSWTLAGMAGGELAPASRAEIIFGEKDEARGSGGCNSFQTSYRIDPPQGLSFGKVTSTLRGCSADIAQQERLFFRALAAVKGYEIDEAGALVLKGADGAMLFRLERKR